MLFILWKKDKELKNCYKGYGSFMAEVKLNRVGLSFKNGMADKNALMFQ